MVNRTGAAPAVPKLQQRSSVQAVIPRVSVNTNAGVNPRAGENIAAAADVLQSVAMRVEDRLDVRAETEALREGAFAGQQGLPELRDEATIRGAAFNRSAKDAAQTQYDLNARQNLSDLEKTYASSPVQFKTKSDAYLRGALPSLQAFDPLMAQEFEANYRLREDAAVKRVTDRHHSILRDQQMESALRLSMSLREDLQVDAQAVVSGDPAEVQSTLARMAQNSVKLAGIGGQVGPDGRSLFSARERISFEQSAQDAVAESVGMAWMQSQTDLLAGYEVWRKGEATIAVDTGDATAQVKLQEMLGPRMYQKVQKTYMENLRSEITLQNQIDGLRERRFNDNADRIFTDISELAQDGPIPMNLVEAAKGQLQPDQYLAARALAKSGGASITDGAVYTDISVGIANGADVRERLNVEYEAGMLRREDYIDLYTRNTQQLGASTRDAVEIGRNFLSQSLGALSSELDLPQSAVLGGANAEYEIAVQDFIEREGRRPTPREARGMADEVKQRYSVMTAEESLLALPLPQSVTHAERLSRDLNSQSIGEKVRAANGKFLAKHGGDVQARDSDPDYQREIQLLKRYFDVLSTKERGAVNVGN